MHATGRDCAGAVALAPAEANCNGDRDGAEALVGLMSAIKRPAVHNAGVELGPWFAPCRGLGASDDATQIFLVRLVQQTRVQPGYMPATRLWRST
jgi:hypothetical protein